MSYFVGIDLGTSGVRTLIAQPDGKILSVSSESYSISTVTKDLAEQSPEEWWKATAITIKDAIKKAMLKPSMIKAISFSGQMHGMVIIDKDLNVIRPAIIWCDQRSKEQINEIYEIIGKNKLRNIVLNSLSTGSLLTSLMWLKENEEKSFNKIFKVMLPKDYIRMRLTGEVMTEYTDASGTLAFDTKNIKWSNEIIEKLGIDSNLFPVCKSSYECAGYVTSKVEEETGLKTGTRVIAGCADQPAQLLGNGVIKSGRVSIIIGTGGQVLTVVNRPIYDPMFRTNTFCNIKEWYVMGAILSAGMSVEWLKKNIVKDFNYSDFDKILSDTPAGSEGLIFLPYIIGERTPHLNANAKAIFYGLTLRHDYKSMVRAIIEGTSFAFRDCIEIFKEMNLETDEIIASGGGTRRRSWIQILSDILGKEIYISKINENACIGAAMLAGIGSGYFSGMEEACSAFIKNFDDIVKPNKKNIELYNNSYGIFKELYKSNESLFDRS